MNSRDILLLGMAACVLGGCSFDASPLRTQTQATQSVDAGTRVPAVDARDAATMPATSSNRDAMPIDASEPDAETMTRAALDATTPACVPLRRPECCTLMAAAAAAAMDICPCPAELDTDHDGLPDCSDPAPRGWLKRLIVDGTQVDATLSDFPLLVRIADPELQAAAQADGSDIHFLADDAITLLDHELEHYAAQDGSLVAWVRLPQLPAGTDTSIYIAYQDGQGDRSHPSALWSDYEYVWHLNQDPSGGAIRDSTGHADGSPQGQMTAADSVDAIAASGIALDGVDDRITFRNVYTGATATTISAWVQLLDDRDDNGAMVISFGRAAQDRARFLMAQDTTNGKATSAGFYSDDVSGPALPGARWSYLVWSWDGATSRLYIDGTMAAGPTPHRGGDTAGSDGAIGASTFNYPRFLKGQIDEVRVANTAQRAAFIHTEYMNQRPDSTFIKAVESQLPQP